MDITNVLLQHKAKLQLSPLVIGNEKFICVKVFNDNHYYKTFFDADHLDSFFEDLIQITADEFEKEVEKDK